MRCPKCNSQNIERYCGGFDCRYCGHMGSAEAFGAKCTCEQPHHLPVWHCEMHGEVVVPMD